MEEAAHGDVGAAGDVLADGGGVALVPDGDGDVVAAGEVGVVDADRRAVRRRGQGEDLVVVPSLGAAVGADEDEAEDHGFTPREGAGDGGEGGECAGVGAVGAVVGQAHPFHELEAHGAEGAEGDGLACEEVPVEGCAVGGGRGVGGDGASGEEEVRGGEGHAAAEAVAVLARADDSALEAVAEAEAVEGGAEVVKGGGSGVTGGRVGDGLGWVWLGGRGWRCRARREGEEAREAGPSPESGAEPVGGK